MAMITIAGIDFRYKDIWALRDVSFDVRRGEFLGIIGPNGSGKSTLIRIVDGILAPEKGDIKINGEDIGGMRRRDLARLVAVVPQDSAMIFPFKAVEVVMMGRSPHLGMLRYEGDRDFEVVRRAMEMTDTLSLAERYMETLSGGERQRILIARALAQEPKVVLLDESTAFLDIRHQTAFFDLMKALNEEKGLTVVAATHDINLAAAYCNRIMLLRNGHIHSLGVPGDVITETNIRAVYETDVLVDDNPLNGLPRVTLMSANLSGRGSRSKAGAAPQL